MKRFLIRLAINAIALYAAVRLVPGISAQSTHFLSLAGLALIFGAINALLRPVLKLLTCPLILFTLGIFTLLLNTFLFYLTGVIGRSFGVGFTVESFSSAFLGSIVVSLSSLALSLFVKERSVAEKRG